jgi:hypothetical protein
MDQAKERSKSDEPERRLKRAHKSHLELKRAEKVPSLAISF